MEAAIKQLKFQSFYHFEKIIDNVLCQYYENYRPCSLVAQTWKKIVWDLTVEGDYEKLIVIKAIEFCIQSNRLFVKDFLNMCDEVQANFGPFGEPDIEDLEPLEGE